MNVPEGAGDGDGDGDGDGFGLLTADAEAAEPEADADQPSTPAVMQSSSAAPSAGNGVFIACSPMPRPARQRGAPGLCQIFGAAAAASWSRPRQHAAHPPAVSPGPGRGS